MTGLVRSSGMEDLFRLAASIQNDVVNPTRQSLTSLNYRVTSEDDAAVAEVEVPGVLPKDVKVRIEGRSLTVETPRGNAFFTLGQRIDADHTVASLKHGLLTIRIPKREARVVEVKVSEEL